MRRFKELYDFAETSELFCSSYLFRVYKKLLISREHYFPHG